MAALLSKQNPAYSSRVKICKSEENDLKHGNYICKSEENVPVLRQPTVHPCLPA
jgi:hypothetical protein